ncbi:MAG: hypothetical protein JOZ99_03570 [Actinobacteria bacterium]|nr:hypothetical protein [Actinomycetota bacterium]
MSGDRRDSFVIFAGVAAIVAIAFAVASFWASSNAQNNAERATLQAERLAEAVTRADVGRNTGGPASASSGSPAVPARAVTFAEQDFAINASTQTLRAGDVTVTIHNFGPSSHELLGFRTNLDDAALPLGPDRNIVEDDPSMTKVFDTETDLRPGTQRVVHLTLTPGHYVFACNLPGHFRLGMHVSVTVVS